jgi:hypothetical protein
MMKIIMITIKIMTKCHTGKYKSAAKDVRSTMCTEWPVLPCTKYNEQLGTAVHSSLQAQ